MYLLRTRFEKEIVAEFLPPTGHKSPRYTSSKVIILCGGMPSVPHKKELMEFFCRKGYWVFFPRYRGSWESGGEFLKISPEQDILDIINQLPRGFRDLFNEKTYRIKSPKIYLIGSSFGGTGAILASCDTRVRRAIALSPVADWLAPSKAEPLDFLEKFTQGAFGEAYRFSHKNWQKLKSGKFYNPATRLTDIDGKKIFIIHAKDDDIVNWKSVKNFSDQTGAKLWLKQRGGHLSSSSVAKSAFYRRIKKFIRS